VNPTPRPLEPTTVTPAVLRGWPLPPPGEDKNRRGRVLIVGGSEQTPGAVRLAAEAALRAGAGKLQIATVGSTAAALAVAVPEALVLSVPEAGGEVAPSQALVDAAAEADAVLIGPGVGEVERFAAVMALLVPRLHRGVVIDAGGLAYVGADGSLPERTVLTPNRTELALAVGIREVVDPGGATLELARRTKVVVTSGGSESWTATPDGELWRDQTGSAGLGVSGSGDVFAGIVTGLLARGAEPAQAAVWATHVHGRTGDRLASAIGRVGFLARELLPEIPRVLAEIEV
jgi:ADP-dependent NAD(P)H-hydrate dehydratase